MKRRSFRAIALASSVILSGIVAVGSGCDSKKAPPAPKKVGPAPKASRPAPPQPAAKPAEAGKTNQKTTANASNNTATATATVPRTATATATAATAKPATPPAAAKTAPPPSGGAAVPVAPVATKKPATPTKPAPKIENMIPAPGPNQPIPAPSDVAAPNTDAKTTKSGLAYHVHREATGTEHPSAAATVEVHYTGWTTDGKMFDSSVSRGETIKFPLDQVIPGWTEGVQLMKVGEITRFWIPEALAYAGRPGTPQGMLVFDVELVSISQPPKAPADVAAAPADAKKTASGIAYKVLKKGTGTVKPKPTDTVEVHYSGWTTDGKMFDSSVMRGEPAQFPLNRVIPGWTEGVGLMVEGEKTLLWIPESLAYGGRPGTPQGMLVFEVELLKIVR